MLKKVIGAKRSQALGNTEGVSKTKKIMIQKITNNQGNIQDFPKEVQKSNAEVDMSCRNGDIGHLKL